MGEDANGEVDGHLRGGLATCERWMHGRAEEIIIEEVIEEELPVEESPRVAPLFEEVDPQTLYPPHTQLGFAPGLI